MDKKLFKVIHPDTGADWTHEELQEYAINNTNLVYCDIEGFLVDEYGALFLADECGNFDILPPDWFGLVWLARLSEIKGVDE